MIQQKARFSLISPMMEASRTPGLKLRRYRKIEESLRHLAGKLRLCEIFRNRGFKAKIEQPMKCYVELCKFTCKYRVDVFATRGTRKIIAEVDGYLGHKTKQAIMLQKLRLRRIRENYGREIEEFRFTLKRLSAWTNEEIEKEMRL